MKTRMLTRSEVERLATMEVAVSSVERAFAAFGRGEASMPPKVYLPIPDHDGDFRAMPSRLGASAGIKWVNVHAQNRKRFGLPTVMAVYVLSDPANAFPLAVMDGTLLTALRTGAAAAVASKYLAQPSPKTIGFIGCGVQAHTLHGTHQVVFDDFESLAYDRNDSTAAAFAERVGARAVTLEEAAAADIVCTATPSRTPFVEAKWIRPGAHINAMGADAPGKQELATDLLQSSAVYIDDIHQATGSGEINVPLGAGDIELSQVAGTLGEVVAGLAPKPGVSTTTIFDSTGLAIQDLALARAVFEAAQRQSIGREIDLLGLDAAMSD
ncbi:MAG: ornithine cyclodeaminase family protein [Deltaproteobacteria bacterium]|nr:ornithine cyclodeaminase family protein [Deltaproteobacteria bacterium]NND27107.1 ornithine cyclodeaminase family protein [Myxococcales bacterium]MBT8466698.1 ornithine cyclodeaminase family protein [Deltaproteobacteria bacterium]MBT8483709.1 ornithine cyclodeaminase family protein [Deltaproteobacteria bacterium]NNK09235.1 ornithine cyclodeaminase family protein [Myxococcales bacterium]